MCSPMPDIDPDELVDIGASEHPAKPSVLSNAESSAGHENYESTGHDVLIESLNPSVLKNTAGLENDKGIGR